MDRSLNEWNERPDAETLAYHARQYDEPYRSTVEFGLFAKDWMYKSKRIIDIGCGTAAASNYLAGMFEKTDFMGADVSENLLAIARKNKWLPNLFFSEFDVLNIEDKYTEIDGVISLQTLHVLPEYETAITQICTKINPRWMAFSTLLYDGGISCKIIVSEPNRPRESYYNIYSLPQMTRYLSTYGYKLTKSQPFIMDRKMPRPSNPDIMQTWTYGDKQISGPLWLPWWFVMYERG